MADIEAIARRIYYTHWREPMPPWENASENVRDWVRKQAESAISEIETPSSQAR